MSVGQANEKVESSISVPTISESTKEKKRRRVKSSETSQEGSVGDMSDMEDVEDTREHEFLSDFMDKVDVSWDEILAKITGSEFWITREASINVMNDEIQELRKENDHLLKRLRYSEGRLTRVEKDLGEAKEKIIDLTSRSMRDNLIFKNVVETEGEDVEVKITNILKNDLKMNVSDCDTIDIKRAHRVGKTSQKYHRNIVACFSSKSKSTIMRHLKNLPKDGIKITEQYPPEIHMRRNKLWPQFIEAKDNQQEARFNMDKLIVNNKVIHPPKDKVVDINLDVSARSLTLTSKHTPVTTKDSNHFQGHTIPVTSYDDVVPAIRTLCSDQRVAGSSHLVYAYKIGNEHSYISNFEDDGEWGGGREVMKVLDDNNLFNYVVAVTRWNGVKTLGQSRFKLIEDTAKKAVSSIVKKAVSSTVSSFVDA
jgi:hypothetical protein